MIKSAENAIAGAVAVHFAAEGVDAVIVYFDEDKDAKDAAALRIRLDAVPPGPVRTPSIPVSFAAEKTALFGARMPMEHAAQLREIAMACACLATDEASDTTGQTRQLNGCAILNP